ncbi:MAG: hypothetical protein PHR65_12050 [Syntrophomonadaceae bacterium]|nr:hypothetical protein [Syntrophomonadaceae bacterium]
MFAKVPAKNGVPQIGKVRLISGTSISDTEAICEIVGELQERVGRDNRGRIPGGSTYPCPY